MEVYDFYVICYHVLKKKKKQKPPNQTIFTFPAKLTES